MKLATRTVSVSAKPAASVVAVGSGFSGSKNLPGLQTKVQVPFKFTGEIDKLTITVEPQCLRPRMKSG